MSFPLGGVAIGAGAVDAGAVAVAPGGPGTSGAAGSLGSADDEAPHATSAAIALENAAKRAERPRNAPMSDAEFDLAKPVAQAQVASPLRADSLETLTRSDDFRL
jgi:hypothetical protein